VRIAIVLFDGAEELDWAGPWEVLAAWAKQWPEDGVEVFTVAEAAGPITCAKGLRVLSDYTWADAPAADVVLWPGGRGARDQLGVESARARVRSLAADDTLMTSVCTGSLVFADAGLLDGRPATTYWGSLDRLGELGSDIRVDRESRFVDDGDVVTAAGVSAGIDMALHLVRRLHSEKRARDVRRYIQYDPEPPV
jgi:transcriptional regulator GlxA family with amidase domain